MNSDYYLVGIFITGALLLVSILVYLAVETLGGNQEALIMFVIICGLPSFAYIFGRLAYWIEKGGKK